MTTHYANIKYFASNAEGVANGAMLFDVQRIRPLFKLEIGKPGSSFAVEIARKIGLPEEIIRAASDKAGSDHINLERQLREIARDKRYWEQKRDRIRLTDRKIEELEQSYAAQLARIRQERSEILRAAKAEARELMAEANRRIEQTIKEIREAQACAGAGKGQSERMTGEQTVAVYENADRSFKYTIPAKSIASFRWGAGAEN